MNIQQIRRDILYSLQPAESKPTFEWMKCTARRYTFMYLGIMLIVTNVLYWLVITVFEHHWIGTIDRMFSLMLVSFLSLCVTVWLYIYDLDNIQHKLTASLRWLLGRIRRLDPSTPGEQLVMMDLHCDDELHEIVRTLNKKSSHIQGHIDYLEKLIWYFQHEFNTPLAITQLHLERLEKQWISNPMLLGIQEELTHMSSLVKALVSLIRSKTEDFDLERVWLMDVVTKITEQLHEIHPDARINIIQEKEIYLQANKQYIWAICRNICENALKHGSDQVNIYIDEHIIRIQDNGFWISEEAREKIRLPFWKKDPRIGKTDWFGLWLSLVKILVEKLDRKVEIQSWPTQWTSFIFTHTV